VPSAHPTSQTDAIAPQTETKPSELPSARTIAGCSPTRWRKPCVVVAVATVNDAEPPMPKRKTSSGLVGPAE